MSELRFATVRRGAHREVPLLVVESLSVRVGIRRVIENLGLEMFEGDAICVSGPNGSGKSTLLNAVAGLDPARIEAGAVRLAGEDLTRMPPHERARRGLAYLRQRQNVFADLTVAENLRIALGPDGPDRFVRFEAESDVRLSLCRRAGMLSGGERQRLAWAMAVLRPSRLLLADEPEAGLSTDLRLPDGQTTLFVSHDPARWVNGLPHAEDSVGADTLGPP